MRANKVIFTCFTAAMLSLALAGCGSQGGREADGPDVGETAAAGPDTDALQSPHDQDTGAASPQSETDTFYLKEGQEASLGEEVEFGDFALVVSDMKITKELGGRPREKFNYWGEEMDGNGNLTGDESYLFVTVSCKNPGDAAREISLNSYQFVTIDESGQICEAAAEARYISMVQEGNSNPAEMFHYRLAPGGETGQVEIGYIIEDSCMEAYAGLYYCIGYQGSALANPENRYIKVDTGR